MDDPGVFLSNPYPHLQEQVFMGMGMGLMGTRRFKKFPWVNSE